MIQFHASWADLSATFFFIRFVFFFFVSWHWNGNVVILTKSSSLAALEVVKMTTSSAASDENFVKMTTFLFQWFLLLVSPCFVNTLRLRQNSHHFPDDILKCIFLNENVWVLIKISQVCSQGSNQQYSSIGSDNGLAPPRRQAIVWAYVGQITNAYVRQSASMDFNWHWINLTIAPPLVGRTNPIVLNWMIFISVVYHKSAVTPVR